MDGVDGGGGVAALQGGNQEQQQGAFPPLLLPLFETSKLKPSSNPRQSKQSKLLSHELARQLDGVPLDAADARDHALLDGREHVLARCYGVDVVDVDVVIAAERGDVSIGR